MQNKSIDEEDIEYIPIKVTSGIIIRIGAGIYNSVAGALKELISNSYDADATHVIISTGYPIFDQIKVVDDGHGMSINRFRIAMMNIGSSLKGTVEEAQETKVFKRPIIGRLGIGLMALSQVCDEAIIESQELGSDTKFIARLDFADFKKREAKQQRIASMEVLRNKYGSTKDIKKKITQEKNKDILLELNSAKELMEDIEQAFDEESEKSKSSVADEHLGYCAIYPSLPAIKGEYGTTITLNNIDSGVKKLLKDIDRPSDALPEHLQEKENGWDIFRDEINHLEWFELCDRLRTAKNQLSYQKLPQYHHFLWELSTMTNVPYFKNGPFFLDTKILNKKKKEIEDYNFNLIVDNKELNKPILLPPGNLGIPEEKMEVAFDYTITPLKYDNIVDNERLSYSGYIYWQRKQVIPTSIRGIQIYIRNVGIGPYDPSLMNFFNVNPTSRAGQISGEIYVEHGLDRALNVDRNSFRETDAHYQALQQQLWNLLGSTSQTDGILGQSVQAYFLRKGRIDRSRDFEKRTELIELINEKNENIKIAFNDKENEEPYQINNNLITVFDKSPAWPRSRDERFFAQKIIVAIQSAVLSGASPSKILQLIEDILLKK